MSLFLNDSKNVAETEGKRGFYRPDIRTETSRGAAE